MGNTSTMPWEYAMLLQRPWEEEKIDSFIEWLKKRNDSNILETFMSSKELKKLQEEPTNESFKSCELAATRIINLFESWKFSNGGFLAIRSGDVCVTAAVSKFYKVRKLGTTSRQLWKAPVLVPCLRPPQLCSTLFIPLGITATPSGYLLIPV